MNAAPPEQVERLNSLMEENPMLSCFEQATGTVLSAQDGTIHKDFRLFLTADSRRPNTHRLSDALRNRVISIQVAEPTQLQELEEIARAELSGVCAGSELATITAKFHVQMRDMMQNSNTTSVSQPTLRSLLHALRDATAGSQENAVQSVVRSLFRTYAGAADPAQRSAACKVAAELLESQARGKVGGFSVLPPRATELHAWQSDAAEVGRSMAHLEQAVLTAAWDFIMGVASGDFDLKTASSMASQVSSNGREPPINDIHP